LSKKYAPVQSKRPVETIESSGESLPSDAMASIFVISANVAGGDFRAAANRLLLILGVFSMEDRGA
jgi:hypothetical protein